MSFKRPAPRVKQYEGANPSAPRAQPVRIFDGPARLLAQVPKRLPKRSVKYRRWVATLACCHCGVSGPIQCAHADENKGMGTKTSDETCFPLCCRCHMGIGSEGWYPKELRRALEREYGLRTQLDAEAAGTWPKGWLGGRSKSRQLEQASEALEAT